MTDLTELKKFLYGQQAYSGFRMALGTVLPGVVLIALFNLAAQGISCALGAFCICLVDVPAPFWRKHRHMLSGTILIGAAAALTICALSNPIALWITLLGICFVTGLATAYGPLFISMSVVTMLSVALMLSQRHLGMDLWHQLGWMVMGGIWYTYFCLFMCRLFKLQMARRSLADCMFATAKYLQARSQCYIPEIPLEKSYGDMIRSQVAVIDAQQEARNLVLANMFVGRHLEVLPERMRLFNILTDIIDMHDSVLAMQVNFESLHNDLTLADANDFMRDLLQKTAQHLNRVASVVVSGSQLVRHFSVKAELRALEYEVQLAKGKPIEPILEAAYARGRSIAAMMEKLLQDLHSTVNTTDITLDVIKKKYFQPALAWRKFHWNSSGWRFALRLSIAIAIGMATSEFLGAHGIWIVITIIVVLRPGFGLTRQRNKYRLIGTLLGCIATQAVLWLVHEPGTLFWLMAISLLLFFSLMRINYLVSVFFATVAILVLYHFVSPHEVLIGQRALDTMIGALIGAAAGYLFPTWEYQLMAPQVASVLKNCRRYGERVFASNLEPIEYRLARRDALVALTGLTASYQRMLQEPLNKQLQVREIGDLVMAGNLLASEIATLAHRRGTDNNLIGQPEFKSVGQVLSAALSGGPVAPLDDKLFDDHMLASMQKSAISIYLLSSSLRLPGISQALKSNQQPDVRDADL